MAASQPDRTEPNPACPEHQWFAPDNAAPGASHEHLISPTRAVEEALACLGTQATSGQVQQLLQERGLDIPVATIDRVRSTIQH